MSNRKRVSIQLAYYTLAQWTAWNGVLLSGQVSIVSDAVGDAVRTKIGDGVTTWTALPYYNPASSSQTLQQTLGFGNTTSGNNLIVTTNDEIYFGGLTKFSQGYDGSTLSLIDVASSDGLYISEGGGLSLKGGGSALDVRADIDINSAGEIFLTGTFYNFSGLSGNKVTYINNSNHLITSNVVTDNNNLFFPSNYGIDNPTPGDVLNIGGSYASTINIGRAGATVNILGTALYEYAANQYVLDKLITLNYGGAVASGTGVGFEIEENNVITGYLKTNASRNGYELLTPAIAYKATLSLASLTANRTLTIPNVAGTLATVDGGQTFTSAVWNGTSITTTYTDAKIKGAAGTTGGILYQNGADTAQTTSGYVIGVGTIGVSLTTTSTSTVVEGLRVALNAGYTGANSSFVSQMYNAAAGTGANLKMATSFSNPLGNAGLNTFAHATTTGYNIGGYYEALGGNLSVGVIGKSITNKSNATNIGVIGVANQTSGTPIRIGGYFGLGGSDTPTFTSAALVADNGTLASPIFLARDNGTIVFSVEDSGNIVLGSQAALATTATNGFAYIPTCAGTPTGVPTAYTGKVAMVFDTTNNKLYIYDGGWLGGTTPGAFV